MKVPNPNPNPVSVTFSVRLSDGSYESSLSVPVGAPEPKWRPVVEAWLLMMQAALQADIENDLTETIPVVVPSAQEDE